LVVMLAEIAAHGNHQKVMHRLMEAQSLLGACEPVFDRTQPAFDRGVEAGFLAHLAPRRLLDRLAGLWRALRQRPESRRGATAERDLQPVRRATVDHAASRH